MEHKIKLTICCSLMLLWASCKKDWLEAKQNINTVVPSTLADLKAILNNSYLTFGFENRSLLDISADEFFYSEDAFLKANEVARNAYLWKPDIFGGKLAVAEWNDAYEQVFAANAVLDGLPKIKVTPQNEQEWNDIKGAALFFRARAFYNLVQLFSPLYDAANEQDQLGIPIRLSADVDAPVLRASVTATYQQIVQDLNEAASLLKEQSTVKTYPIKAAAYALLARCYLTMADYHNAAEEAKKALELHGALMDYNEIDRAAAYPFDIFNDEVLFSSQLAPNYYPYYKGRVDTLLYDAYEEGDCRKVLYFIENADGYHTFRGSYYGAIQAFGGLAVDEVLLIHAEALARLGNKEEAMAQLNWLLKHRYTPIAFVPHSASTDEEALEVILEERKKELVFRGLRWTDIRRLNKEGYGITLLRKLDGVTYSLQPNDAKYILPIPDYIIQQSSINQNNR